MYAYREKFEVCLHIHHLTRHSSRFPWSEPVMDEMATFQTPFWLADGGVPQVSGRYLYVICREVAYPSVTCHAGFTPRDRQMKEET